MTKKDNDMKQVSIYVPRGYKHGGSEIKRELDELFQYIWDSNPKLLEKYPKFEKVKSILTWNKEENQDGQVG